MTLAFLTRIQTLLTTGQPNGYAGSDMAKADWEAFGSMMALLTDRPSMPIARKDDAQPDTRTPIAPADAVGVATDIGRVHG